MEIKLCYNCKYLNWMDWNIVTANSKFTHAIIPYAFCKKTIEPVLGLEGSETCDYERRKGSCGMSGIYFEPSDSYLYQLNKEKENANGNI